MERKGCFRDDIRDRWATGREALGEEFYGVDLSILLLTLSLLRSLYYGQGYGGGHEDASNRWSDHGDGTRQLHGILRQ